MNSQAEALARFKAERAALAGDMHRPTFHFVAPANWMNDPNGMIQWQGRYHLFYQYNPHGAFHAKIHWGHAVSDDLVYWQDLPVALAPEDGLYDQDGCWSGCAVNNDGAAMLFYTSVPPQAVAAAVSQDGLHSWRKLAENPLIPGPPDEIGLQAGGHFRDPFVWRHSGGWHMLMASKIEVVGGQILLYHSTDLLDWRYRGIFLAGDAKQAEPFWQGTMWECPNLLDFGARQVLLISVQATATELLYSVYYTGNQVADHFEPVTSDLLVHGGAFYAPQVMRADDERYILFGWLHEGRSQQACLEAGWNGIQSLPLEVTLGSDDAVTVTPVAELAALRGDRWHEGEINLEEADEYKVPHPGGQALELSLTLLPESGADCGLKLLCSPDGRECTEIIYRGAAGLLFVEREHASQDLRADHNAATMPLSLAAGEPLCMRIFVDHSVIEIFVNERLCLACRVYPSRSDSRGVRLFSRGGPTVVREFNLWPMAPIWPTGEVAETEEEL